MSRFFNGNEGIVKSNGVEVCINKWDLERSVDEQETTSTCDAGYYSSIAGSKKATISVDFKFDASQNIAGNPPDINEGSVVALQLYLESRTGPYFDFPKALILSVKITSTVNGVVEGSFNAVNQGPYTVPTTDF